MARIGVVVVMGTIMIACGVANAAGAAPVDASGARKLSKVPQPGIHPRVYFSPEDMPEFRDRYLSSEMGKVMQGICQKQFKDGRKGLEEFASLDLTSPTIEQLQKYFRSDEGRNIRWGMYTVDAVVRDDKATKDLMARVITNYAKIILASKEKAIGNVHGGTGDVLGKTFNVWKQDSFDVGVSWTFGAAGFAVSYDLLYNDMSENQQDTVRKAIAAATSGRKSHGMGFPKGRAISNHYGYHGDLAVMLAAIEGEPGFDAVTYRNIEQVMMDYWDVGFESAGACHEDLYGPNLGLRAGSQGLMVMARRGKNIFNTEKYKNFTRYIASEFEPYPTGMFIGGASGGPGLPFPTSMIVMKYMLPGDPVANYNWRYYVGDDYRRNLQWQGWLDYALFGMDWSGQKDARTSLAGTDMKLTSFYPRRGKLICRSSWDTDAIDFHLDARPDAFTIGHDTVDRGHFIISALGRPWAVRGSWQVFRESTDHSLVHIDGRAQTWKAPSVKFMQWQDAGEVAAGVADLKYAYDWQWSPPWPSKEQKFAKPWEPEMSDPRTLGWPDSPDWLPNKLYDEPGIGYLGSWMWRKSYNPVQKAFRSGMLVRGAHPYVVIVDDVRKDDGEHVYDWYMQVAGDLSHEVTADNDVILKDDSNRRMLVRVLQADGKPAKNWAKFEEYDLSEQRKGQQTKGKRLVVTAKSVEPKFKILLVPFKENDALPKTTLNKGNDSISIEWSDQKDAIGFKTGSDGRTRIDIERGEKSILSLK
jgi:hypothetical protein